MLQCRLLRHQSSLQLRLSINVGPTCALACAFCNPVHERTLASHTRKNVNTFLHKPSGQTLLPLSATGSPFRWSRRRRVIWRGTRGRCRANFLEEIYDLTQRRSGLQDAFKQRQALCQCSRRHCQSLARSAKRSGRSKQVMEESEGERDAIKECLDEAWSGLQVAAETST